MNSFSANPLEIELIEHCSRSVRTGTGRYMRELYGHLSAMVSVRWVSMIDPPFTGRLSSLHHFPLGIHGHRHGNIVHFSQPLGSSMMVWRPVRPAVVTVHDLSWMVWPPEARMFRKLERQILRLSYLGLKYMDAVIAVSNFTRQTIVQKLGIPSERVFTVYSGNRADLFKPLTGARARLSRKFGFFHPGEYQYLLYVGNEFPRKNLAVLLEALSLLPTHIRLLKVGEAGGERFRIATRRLLAKYGVEDRVIFVDQVSDEDLVLLYNAVDLYVCSSFLEGFCHPILEAMACGTPVISSNAGSLPEVAGDAALLVSPDRAEPFAQAILAVLEDRGRREQMSARSLQHAAAFSWDQTARGVTDVYRLVTRGE